MERTIIESGFYILRYTNDEGNTQRYEEPVSSEFIQFHFCQKGSGSFEFNGGSYQLPLMSKNVILLYNPQRALPIDLNLTPDSAVVSLVISIKKFHSLFSEDAKSISLVIEIEPKLSKVQTDTVYFKLKEVLDRYEFDQMHTAGKVIGQAYYIDQIKYELQHLVLKKDLASEEQKH